MKNTSKIFTVLLGKLILLLIFTVVGQAVAQTWTQLSPTGGPPVARWNHSAVYDQTNNRMIVFGGGSSIVNDTWVLTNANGQGGTPTWTQLSTTGGPPPAREAHTAVYDQANNRMIIFGGDNGVTNSQRNDVWVLTNANGLGGIPTWTQLFPTGGPPAARSDHSAVYDPGTNRMTVFGGNLSIGNCFVVTNDVWVLTNANGLGGTPTWTQLSPTGGAPPCRGALHLSLRPDD